MLALVASAALGQNALNFVPIAPCRVVDTRSGNAPYISGGTSRNFTIAGVCGIPSTAQAFSFNVGVVPRASLGFLTVWPAGQSQPTVSTLNSPDSRIKAVAAIIPEGDGGAVSVYASGDTDVFIDVDGYFVAATTSGSLAFYPVTPCRLVDTRINQGTTGGALTGGTSRTFALLSDGCGLPSGALAYSLNFTAVPTGPSGFYLTAYPTGTGLPLASTLNDNTATVVANAAISQAGVSGSIDVYASGNTNLAIDVNGYFAAPGAGGLSLYTVTPCRVLDTRQGAGSPFSGTINVNVLASGCLPFATPQAYVFNATAIPQGPLGYLELWPQGASQPVVSTLNAVDGAIANNMAIVPTSNTEVSAFASNSTHLVLDLFGYFAGTQVSTDLSSFNTCIGATGTAGTCALMPNPMDPYGKGRYTVNSPPNGTGTLTIRRSGIAVTGVGGPGDVVLVRGDPSMASIMIADAGVTNVTIENLTFDGNRYGFGLPPTGGISCLPFPYGVNYIDIDVGAGGTFILQWLNFINAPGWDIDLAGTGSSVSLSNFGQGGYGNAPDGMFRMEDPHESATRWAAIYLSGSSNGAWYNAISYAGNGAIDITGSYQYFYGNLVFQNRYEMSDWAAGGGQGGQVYLEGAACGLDGPPQLGCAWAATVAGNVIDGNFWQTDLGTQLMTLCQAPQSGKQFPSGIEVYGYNHYFYNNEVENHSANGLGGAGSDYTGRITISSQNPFDPTDTPKYIEMNQDGGIVFLGTYSPPWTNSVQGVTLYNVNVRNNAGFDVDLDGASNDSTAGVYGPYYGFLNGSCIIPSNNYGPVAGQPVNGQPHQAPLTTPR